MHPKKTSSLPALVLLVIVACVSLAIVGGVVTWMAAREGTDLSQLVAEMLEGPQSARPALAQTPPRPTFTPRPSPTPRPTATDWPTATRAQPVATATFTPLPTQTPTIDNLPSPTVIPMPSPTATPEPRIESAIQSPIRSGSPLPERPATRLVIPTMDLDVPVTISPIVNQTWKVDHLGTEFVGHLEGTASPGDSSNVVLAGHVTVAHNVYGPFAGLWGLEPGDPVILYEGDQAYTYIVDYRQLVDRTDVGVAYPTDTGRITLITCSNWSDELGAYQQRLVVVGHLVGAGS